MDINMKKISILFLLTLFVFILMPNNSSAHVGCVASTTEVTGLGYMTKCEKHSESRYIYYYTTTGMDSKYKSFVTSGAAKWNNTGVTNIIAGTVGVGGHVYKYTDANTSTIAAVGGNFYSSTGHWSSWYMKMNTSKLDSYTSALSNGVIAHEFGHVIGLRDLYTAPNTDKLMYAYVNPNTFTTSPTSADIAGAKKAIYH